MWQRTLFSRVLCISLLLLVFGRVSLWSCLNYCPHCTGWVSARYASRYMSHDTIISQYIALRCILRYIAIFHRVHWKCHNRARQFHSKQFNSNCSCTLTGHTEIENMKIKCISVLLCHYSSGLGFGKDFTIWYLSQHTGYNMMQMLCKKSDILPYHFFSTVLLQCPHYFRPVVEGTFPFHLHP